MAHRLAPLLAVLLGAIGPVGAAVPASPDDPLQAPECRRALAALQREEAVAAAAAATSAAASGPRTVDPKLAAARKRAARLCLATRADRPPPAGRFAQPPIAAPPVVGARPPPAPASTGSVLPERAPAPAPLVSITSCDIAGCWTSDGTRLNRVGPTLWGSRGACSVVGTVVHCP